MQKYTQEQREDALALISNGLSERATAQLLNIPRTTIQEWRYKVQDGAEEFLEEGPKVLFIDIETAPLLSYCYGMFQQNIGLNQIHKDWYMLSYAAKWANSDKIIYNDKSDSWNTEDDSMLLEEVWELLDQADIVIGHNMRKFDHKKINARFMHNDMKPPRPYRIVDTLEMAKRAFGFTSNKLAYLTDKLCKTYKKLDHGAFPGFEMWKQCMLGNQDAWEANFQYNSYDVLSLQELYEKLRPWDNKHPNINTYYSDVAVRCTCGSEDLKHSGYWHTNLSKFDLFRCQSCGSNIRGRVNLLSKDKRQSLNANIAN